MRLFSPDAEMEWEGDRVEGWPVVPPGGGDIGEPGKEELGMGGMFIFFFRVAGIRLGCVAA